MADSVGMTVARIAASLGVDPVIAIADAQVESGFRPDAVGDNGTSFGLYQLHQGGELGSMSPQQAFDPATNAQRALSEFQSVLKANDFRPMDPGQLAFAAQRPAASAKTQYVNSVDTYYNNFLNQSWHPPGMTADEVNQVLAWHNAIGGSQQAAGASTQDTATAYGPGSTNPIGGGQIAGGPGGCQPIFSVGPLSGGPTNCTMWKLGFTLAAVMMIWMGFQILRGGNPITVVTSAATAPARGAKRAAAAL